MNTKTFRHYTPLLLAGVLISGFSSTIVASNEGFEFDLQSNVALSSEYPSSMDWLAVNSGEGSASSGGDAPKAKSGGMSAAEANQALSNPITSFTLFLVEHDTTALQGNITGTNKYLDVTLIEPVIPIAIGDSGWNLVNRPVIPIVRGPIPKPDSNNLSTDWDYKQGLGDIVAFSLIKPPSTGAFQWGIGPTLTMPTASNDAQGSQKWSAGPAAIALYSSPKTTFGALVQQWWSFAGNDNRDDVSLMNLQYFYTHQFNDRWAFITAPVVTGDWKADSGNKWSVPVSAGVA